MQIGKIFEGDCGSVIQFG